MRTKLQHHGRADLVDAFKLALTMLDNPCTCEHCEHYHEEFLHLDESYDIAWCEYHECKMEKDDTCDNFSRG